MVAALSQGQKKFSAEVCSKLEESGHTGDRQTLGKSHKIAGTQNHLSLSAWPKSLGLCGQQ